MEKNKDLPKEEQLRIILRNYDSKKAECDALVKENSELRKTIKEKRKRKLNHTRFIKINQSLKQ